MAKNDRTGKTSLLSKIKAAGFEVSKVKTTLWAVKETLAEAVEDFDFYVSTRYEGSAFCIVREGDESILIPFYKNEIDVADYEGDDKGLVASSDVEFNIDIKEMVALRDDEELEIKKGDTALRAFVS